MFNELPEKRDIAHNSLFTPEWQLDTWQHRSDKGRYAVILRTVSGSIPLGIKITPILLPNDGSELPYEFQKPIKK